MNGSKDAYIIMVEDDPNSYLVVGELLKHAGYQHFYHRNSGNRLMALVDSLPQVDLVLLDIGLPGQDGFSLLKLLRANPKTAHVHIAALTANVMHEIRLRAKDAGFDSFLSKPVQPDKIADQIHTMLNGRSLWW